MRELTENEKSAIDELNSKITKYDDLEEVLKLDQKLGRIRVMEEENEFKTYQMRQLFNLSGKVKQLVKKPKKDNKGNK